MDLYAIFDSIVHILVEACARKSIVEIWSFSFLKLLHLFYFLWIILNQQIILIIRMFVRPKISLEPLPKRSAKSTIDDRQLISKRSANLRSYEKKYQQKYPITIVVGASKPKNKRMQSMTKTLTPTIPNTLQIMLNNRRRQYENQQAIDLQMCGVKSKAFSKSQNRNNIKSKASSISKTRNTQREQIRYNKPSMPAKKFGLSKQQLFQRKESNLNTRFNLRKNNLKNITKENKKIYQRINSQKSLYSNSDLNKSYQSNCSLSRRLSQSKISRKCTNSISSSRKKTERVLTKKKQSNLVFESKDVNRISNQQMRNYLDIFGKKKIRQNSTVGIENTNQQKVKPTYKKSKTPMMDVIEDKQNRGKPARPTLEKIVEEMGNNQKSKNSWKRYKVY